MAVSSTLPSPSAALAGTSLVRRRWVQLLVGILAMVMVANLQYGWTLFVTPIDARHHWGKAAIQVAFTVFVLFETWLVPFEAYLVDRFGPGLLVGIGGVLVGLAWSVNSVASSLPVLYLGVPWAASAPASSTAPRSATRSSGSPTDAVWRQA
jgi:MFS transporter, OFA family, oxalate/formate antiporter